MTISEAKNEIRAYNENGTMAAHARRVFDRRTSYWIVYGAQIAPVARAATKAAARKAVRAAATA